MRRARDSGALSRQRTSSGETGWPPPYSFEFVAPRDRPLPARVSIRLVLEIHQIAENRAERQQQTLLRSQARVLKLNSELLFV